MFFPCLALPLEGTRSVVPYSHYLCNSVEIYTEDITTSVRQLVYFCLIFPPSLILFNVHGIDLLRAVY